MSTQDEVAETAALERLLDAELATTFGRPTGGARPRPVAVRGRWASAAVVLLGIALAVGTWWTHREDGRAPAAPPGEASQEPVTQEPVTQEPVTQEPAPHERAPQDPALALPPATRVEKTSELAGLAAGVQNLECRLDRAADIARLQRFAGLRRLVVRAYEPERSLGRIGKLLHPAADWAQPGAAVLAPLAGLERLEQLELPPLLRVDGAALAALAPARRLARLTLGQVAFDAACAGALAHLPALRSLRLAQAELTVAGIAALATAPLERLELGDCRGLDAAALAALAGVQSLVELRIEYLGKPAIDAAPAAAAELWRPAGAEFEPLARLTHLRTLELARCELRGDALLHLPPQIETLALAGTMLDSAAGLRALARLSGLRHLEFHERGGYGFVDLHGLPPKEAAAALADAIAKLRIATVRFQGYASAELLRELAAQPDLRELTLTGAFGEPDVEPGALPRLAASRSLQTLRLVDLDEVQDEDVGELAACPSLRRVEARSCRLLSQDGLAAKLPGVAVEVLTTEQLLRSK